MTQDHVLTHLLFNNVQWSEAVEKANPGFFARLAALSSQEPKILWIGCADSRCPESVAASMPGDIFVHRNIANQYLPTDDSAVAAVDFAVNNIGVDHILVVGHTRCGGVEMAATAAMNLPMGPPTTPMERWLAPLTEFARGVEPQGDVTALMEANIRLQVENIAKSDVLQQAWTGNGNSKVQVHGWVYELETGRLRDLGVTVGKQ